MIWSNYRINNLTKKINTLIKSLELETSNTAFNTLIKIGRKAVPCLCKAKELDVGSATLIKIIKILVKIGDKNAVPFLATLLEDTDAQVRDAAYKALEERGALTTELKIARYVSDLDDMSLGIYFDEGSAEYGNKGKRGAAMEELVKICHPDIVIPRLLDVLTYGYNLDPYEAQTLSYRFSNANEELIYKALRKIGQPAVPILIKELDHSKWDMRAASFDVLKELGKLTPDLELKKYIKDLNDQDRKFPLRFLLEAIKALSKIGDKTIIPALIKLLYDLEEEDVVRATAAEALIKIGHARGIEALQICLEEDNEYLVTHIVETLAKSNIQNSCRLKVTSLLEKIRIDINPTSHLHKVIDAAIIKANQGARRKQRGIQKSANYIFRRKRRGVEPQGIKKEKPEF